MRPVNRLETGVIYCDENLQRLAQFPDGSVDLCYLDPPFFSNRQYEVIWGDEAEVRSFEDRWQGGMRHYIDWMRKRVAHLHRVLKPNGSLYLHCDPAASHYLKVMVDGLFGQDRFRNEVVWKRTSAHSSARRYGPVHDTILFYAKGDDYTWNQLDQEYAPEYVAQRFARGDDRPWKDADLTGSGIRRGETGLPWRGFDPTMKGRHWAYPPDVLDQLDAEGRVYWPKKPGAWPRFKRYLDESRGVPVQDIWTDIPPLNSQARERLGYPTQKPEALMERIISASSNKGDVVLDPYCGCGTTLAVAERLQRRWVGIDISPTAVRLIKRRLTREGAFPQVYGLPETEADLRSLQPFEFQNWVIAMLHGTHSSRKTGDLGIDGYSFLERLPIQVKQSDRVGRNVVDNFETAIRRDGSHKGYIIAFSFGKGAYEEVARVKSEGLEIELVPVSTLLENPTDAPLQPDLPDMTRDLLESARKAAAQATLRETPPPREAEELVESARRVG